MLNDDSMAACRFLGIFMTRKVLGSLSEFSRESIKPTQMMQSRKIIFTKTVKNAVPPYVIEGHLSMNLIEIKHLKR